MNASVYPHRRRFPADMASYLVVFDEWTHEASDRRQRAVGAQAQAAENRRRLTHFIETAGLGDSVASVGESTTLGIVGVVATQTAAEQLRQMKGVARVVRAD